MKILVDDDDEQKVIEQIREWADSGIGISEMARKLNEKGWFRRKGRSGAKSLICNLRLRMGQISPRPINTRSYSDREVRARILELRREAIRRGNCVDSERTGWIPRKGKQFTERGIHGLLRTIQATKVLSPRGYLEMMLTKMERVHGAEHPTVPFSRPTLEEMGKLLRKWVTSHRGHEKWWPAQVAQVLEGDWMGTTARECPMEFGKGRCCPSDLA